MNEFGAKGAVFALNYRPQNEMVFAGMGDLSPNSQNIRSMRFAVTKSG